MVIIHNLEHFQTRVFAYIDGYNVYYGLDSKKENRYLWLDYRALLESQLREGETLEAVKYFTALGRKQSPESDKRQNLYLDALRAHGGVEVLVKGSFTTRPWKCPFCEKTHKRPHEKKTDVALAVALLTDAFHDRFDSAWLLCADADFIPAVLQVKEEFPDKRICLVTPRGRHSDELADVCDAVWHLERRRWFQSQLPNPVVSGGGVEFHRPAEWQHPDFPEK